MKLNQAIMAMGVSCLLAGNAGAALLGVNPSYPQINYNSSNPNSVSYDPVTQNFSVNSTPFGIVYSGADPGSTITGSSLQIQFTTDGTTVINSTTNGFVLSGTFTHVDGGVTNSYSGILLQGEVIAFGYLDSSFSDQYDFRVHLTGGLLMSQFSCGDDLAMTLVSESSTFSGDFTVAFNGSAAGTIGPEDMTPPDVTCPPLSQVVTTPTTNNGVAGFVITYPDPIVTDNCDPAPTIFEDTPSGTFVALNPGDTLTITCFGIDVSGNFNFCSFTVTMGQGQTGSCPLAFTDSGCGLTTLTNDPGKCSTAYTFSAPTATNCSGQVFTASATAINQSGTAISLTSLGNGNFQGIFPHTTSGSNVITFTVDDGNGNTITRQCVVEVIDAEAPTILCQDQSATFKPIETNALSCIEADFNNINIAASNFIWFTSAIQTPSSKASSFTVHIFDQTIQLSVDNSNIVLNVPEAFVTFSNGVPRATTTFSNGVWVTIANSGFSGKVFASGLEWQVPFNLDSLTGKMWGRDADDGHGFRHHVNSATWCARFAVDTPGVVVQWQWGAVVHSTMDTNCNNLGVKPCDDNHESNWQNSDPAGTCENFKSALLPGARGQGWYKNGHTMQPDCTGIMSETKRANLGVGILCEGPVEFQTPMAADNCDNSVVVTCDPPSGSIFGPGDHTIMATAVDSSGNSNFCTFTLTVLSPLQVVFDCPGDDNMNDNTFQRDEGFTDMNCPDDPSTTEIVTRFTAGDRICHVVRLLDCNGNDVTSQMAQCCTVHIDVTEREGTYFDSVLVQDLTQGSNATGTPGALMIPSNGTFQYVLDTTGYEPGTSGTSKFFRCCVWVEYNSTPGVPVGMEDVLLESK